VETAQRWMQLQRFNKTFSTGGTTGGDDKGGSGGGRGDAFMYVVAVPRH